MTDTPNTRVPSSSIRGGPTTLRTPRLGIVLDDRQTPEEMAAHLGDEGPAPVAEAWLAAIYERGSWELALSLCTEHLRRRVAEDFVDDASPLGGQSLADAVAALSRIDRSHPLWPSLSSTWLGWFGNIHDGTVNDLAFGSRPRPVDIDHEIVVVVDYRSVDAPVEDLGAVGPGKRPTPGTVPTLIEITLVRAPEAPGGWQVSAWAA